MKLKITQVKSKIGSKPSQRKTLEALGLKGIRKSVVHNQTSAIKGMLRVVNHLISVEEQK